MFEGINTREIDEKIRKKEAKLEDIMDFFRQFKESMSNHFTPRCKRELTETLKQVLYELNRQYDGGREMVADTFMRMAAMSLEDEQFKPLVSRYKTTRERNKDKTVFNRNYD